VIKAAGISKNSNKSSKIVLIEAWIKKLTTSIPLNEV